MTTYSAVAWWVNIYGFKFSLKNVNSFALFVYYVNKTQKQHHSSSPPTQYPCHGLAIEKDCFLNYL